MKTIVITSALIILYAVKSDATTYHCPKVEDIFIKEQHANQRSIFGAVNSEGLNFRSLEDYNVTLAEVKQGHIINVWLNKKSSYMLCKYSTNQQNIIFHAKLPLLQPGEYYTIPNAAAVGQDVITYDCNSYASCVVTIVSPTEPANRPEF